MLKEEEYIYECLCYSLKKPGGKFWKGAANNGAGNITTTSDELNSGAGGTETSKPAAAVRFIQLNDADLEEDQGKAGSHHSSAFQQLFPRARKLLLQDLPEAEIQRLTTNARVNAAVSSTSSFSRSNNNTTSSTLHLSTNDDLKYMNILLFITLRNVAILLNESSRLFFSPQWRLPIEDYITVFRLNIEFLGS